MKHQPSERAGPRAIEAIVRVVAVLQSTAVVVALSACSIQPDAAPREIPEGERSLLDPVTPEGGEAAGSTRVFLVADGDDGQRRLRSVLRRVDATPTAALEELFKGANDEEDEAGLGTELPAGLTLLDADPIAGTLQVDVSQEILDLPAPALLLAVAEIVFTASELDGVSEVRLKVNGQNREWPDGSGELQSRALTVYDYPGLAESSQPAYPPIPSEQPTT